MTAKATATGGAVTGVDLVAVRAWMVETGLAVVGSIHLQRVGLGQSNLTFRVVDDAGAVWVLRRPPLGQLLESAHDVVREARIMSALTETSVPVPQVHGVLPPGVVGDDVPAFLMSWVDGTVIDTMAGATALETSTRRAVSRSLARAMASVHAVNLETTGLLSLASNRPYAPRQIKRWAAQWEQSRTRALPVLDQVTDWLEQHLPEEREMTLVHGDLHVRNVIVNETTRDVAAVLDWELSTLGHPLADLGTLLAYWPGPDEQGLDSFVPSHLEGFATQRELIEFYAEASGRDVADIDYWHVLGLWKLAIIAEGVLRRTIDEPLNKAAEGTPVAERIDGLLDRALRVIERG